MKYVLAPIAGFTDAPFRVLCREGGADETWTEMVSAAGLRRGSMPTRRLLATMPEEGPAICQIFGADELDVALATEFIHKACRDSFCALNLNAGCPMSKITRNGAGSKLMESPELTFRLLKAMKENTDLPVTLKTRLGPRPGRVSVFDMLAAAESAGAAGIAVHARYASQMHGGRTDLDMLAEVVRKSKIPVTGNGSVTDAASAAAMAATGVSAIMIGRAALKEPDIFKRIKEGSLDPCADLNRAVRMCRRHVALARRFADMLEKCSPGERLHDRDAWLLVKYKTHFLRYFSGCPGSAAIRAAIGAARSVEEAESGAMSASCGVT